MQIAKEIYWNIPLVLAGIHYGLFGIAAIIFFLGIRQRYRLWRLGTKDNRFHQPLKRIGRVITHALFQSRILRDPYAAVMHSFILYGFGLLFIGTMLVLIQADLGLQILKGPFYLYFSLVLDLAGLALILGLVLAFIRRYIIEPLNPRRRLDNRFDDLVAIILIIAIALGGFLLEGIRIHLTELTSTNRAFSPIGTSLAALISSFKLDESGLKNIYQYGWFIHSTLAIIFIAYIPYSKLWHILTGPVNIYFSNLGHKGTLSTPDLEKSETFGVSSVKEFTWKHLLDLDACTRCGRCQVDCPTHLSDKPLSPKKLITDLKSHLESKGRKQKAICGDIITEDAVWACTTCRFCQEHCPVLVEHIDKIIELRRNLVLSESRFPSEVKSVFKNMETQGNPWPVSWDQRSKWTEGLNIKVLSETNPKTEWLLWVGCAAATDERNTKVIKALVNILQSAGVDFAILGNAEKCCGDPARRIGNEYLYQMLAEENIQTLKKYQFQKIITTCPHCYNTLKNEYTQLRISQAVPKVSFLRKQESKTLDSRLRGNDRGAFWTACSVVHHTEFIQQLIKQGRLKLPDKLDKTITYHDSCYLGRYNQIYQPPRDILSQIKNVNLKEMPRRRSESLCCGAGGGRMWMEEKIGKRINHLRVEEALKTKATIIATACPYCLTMLEDGIKEKDQTETIKARDIVEILAAGLSRQETS